MPAEAFRQVMSVTTQSVGGLIQASDGQLCLEHVSVGKSESLSF